MLRENTKMILENLVRQMDRQRKAGLGAKIRINGGVASFSSEKMAGEKIDLNPEEISFLRSIAAKKGFKV